MGKRLSKIYTRTGDQGETGLGDGSRIFKNQPRVVAMGDIDELNAHLGLLIEQLNQSSMTECTEWVPFLRYCQHRIFDLGGEISIPGFELIHSDHVALIETELDKLNEPLAPLENFILPGGSLLIAQCHVARCTCRRAERAVITLSESDTINAEGLKFLNRFSDFLFVLCRSIAVATKTPEVLWQKDHLTPSAESLNRE